VCRTNGSHALILALVDIRQHRLPQIEFFFVDFDAAELRLRGRVGCELRDSLGDRRRFFGTNCDVEGENCGTACYGFDKGFEFWEVVF